MPDMDDPPSIPFEFDVRTIVFLIRPDDAPDLPETELDRLQEEHLAYGANLFARGLTVVNGPLSDQSDPSMRGITIYTVGPDEALDLASRDPSVRAGRLRAEVARWWTAADRIAFPDHDGPVGERLSYDDMG
jgi:hypothetical protein